jgi:hypothetical protein
MLWVVRYRRAVTRAQGKTNGTKRGAKDFASTGADIAKTATHLHQKADRVPPTRKIGDASGVMAMNSQCWSAAERTGGVLPGRMDGQSEGLIDLLDTGNGELF